MRSPSLRTSSSPVEVALLASTTTWTTSTAGATVYLKAEPDVLYGHLKMGRVVRPLLLNKTTEEVREFIHRQLAEREPFYNKAKYIFDVSLLDNYEKIESTVADLRKMLGIDP